MSLKFLPRMSGYTISFQTRGLSIGEVTLIWERLSPIDLKSLVADTGHNLCVWGDGLCVHIERGRGDIIVIWCGKEQSDESI